MQNKRNKSIECYGLKSNTYSLPQQIFRSNTMDKFRLTDSFLDKYKRQKAPFGFNGLGELVYLRTYSRIKENGENERWWETVQRVVEGTFNMQKRWIEAHRLGWSSIKAQKSAQEMYERIFTMKFLPPGRGLWAMGSPITEERGLYMALNNCFSSETKILTREGYKSIGGLVDSTQTLLTTNCAWVDAEIKSFGVSPLRKLVLQRQGIKKEIYVTANHVWFAKSKSAINHSKGYSEYTTDQLKLGYRLAYTFGQKPSHYSPQGISHGICFGDGTNNHIYLIGEKDRELLKWFPLNRNSSAPEKNAVRVADIPEHYKQLPSIKWDRKYLLGWLMGYFAADGSVTNGQVTISSSNKNNLLFLQDVAAVCGIGTYDVRLSSISSNFQEERELWQVTFMPDTLSSDFFLIKTHQENFSNEVMKKNWVVVSVENTDRIEEVFCAVVPNTQAFVIEGNILTHNCSFCSTSNIKEDFAKPFCFLMDVSMLGVGCGFDVKGEGKIQVHQPVASDTNIFVIPDTREGWVESVRLLIESYLLGTKEITLDYSKVRKAGEPIKGFGGVSSGPDPLKELHKGIRSTLKKNIGSPITLTSIVDIMNMIGKCVVAGNVRRTAEIVFGDHKSSEYLDLKNYEVNPHRESYGWTSNNSIFCDLGMNYAESVKRTIINGDPGYAWLHNMKSYSRMNNGPDNKDWRVEGGNPCLEQSLESYEVCNLVETFPDNHETLDDYLITLKYAYLYAKTVTLGETHWPETNRVMLRNRRIGCSMSGIAQFVTDRGIHELRQWCEEGYKKIEYYDEVYSDWLAIPKSIKKTSIKPSGTVSLLAGATPGVHYPENVCYIRRIRLSNHSELVEPLKEAGYRIEPCFGSEDSTVVVEMPVKIGDKIRSVSQVSVWEQAALAAFMQRYWADNQVSCTITFRKEEKEQLEPVLNFYQYQLKGISFLPLLEGTASHKQMPYESITDKKYQELISKLKPIKFKGIRNEEADVEKFCNNDVCVLK